MRAKTVNIPKDFREELLKLQKMKQKIGIEPKQPNNDVVSVSTLNRDSGGWHQQTREEIKIAVQKQLEEDKQSSPDQFGSLYGLQLLKEKEIQRAQRQAEMDQLLTKLEGNLKKTKSKSFHQRAHSSDRAMAMPKDD